jgi:CheY-like chemotaxis protein
VGESMRAEDRRLVLLVDHDVESRRHARHLLERHGLEVVQASNGMAALELIQRLPRSFLLVLTEIDLPGLSGTIVAETLRVFRPDLPTLCMSTAAGAGVPSAGRCLAKPLQSEDLLAAIRNGREAYDGDGRPRPSEDAVARARARFAAVGDLVEAALELARTDGAEDRG